MNVLVKSTKRYKELDALRGIASLMVVFFHYTMGRPQASVGFVLGTTGVDLFFIISGFVIFMSLTSVTSSTDFIINRVSRLYPTYWTAVTFAFIILLIGPLYKTGSLAHAPWLTYIANMTMFQHYLGAEDLDGPYWTMLTEMLFYIGILFLFHFNWLKNVNKIGLALCILSAASVQSGYLTQIVEAVPVLQFIPLFFAGIVFYKLYTIKTGHIAGYLMLAVCFVCQVLLFHAAGRSRWFINLHQYIGMLGLFFAVFILFVNHLLNFIVNRVTLFLGRISFALYLIHYKISAHFILPWCIDKWHMSFWAAALLVSLPIVVLLAAAITFYVEVPLGKKMKSFLRNKFSVKPAIMQA